MLNHFLPLHALLSLPPFPGSTLIPGMSWFRCPSPSVPRKLWPWSLHVLIFILFPKNTYSVFSDHRPKWNKYLSTILNLALRLIGKSFYKYHGFFFLFSFFPFIFKNTSLQAGFNSPTKVPHVVSFTLSFIAVCLLHSFQISINSPQSASSESAQAYFFP